jgi:DNA primase
MHVDPQKRLFHCFGCGASGTIYDLLREMGYSIQDALTRQDWLLGLLAQGVAPSRAPFLQDVAPRDRYNTYWNEIARQQMQKIVPFGVTYLLSRGIPAEVLGICRVDYRNGLFLFRSPVAVLGGQDPFGEQERVVQAREAAKAGAYISIGTASPYGRLRYWLDGDTPPPEMKWILVEGAIDALAVVATLLQTRNTSTICVVAICGKIPEQIPMGEIVLLFDSDVVGIGYQQQAAAFYVSKGLTIRHLPLPEGKDPADVYAVDGGASLSGILNSGVVEVG